MSQYKLCRLCANTCSEYRYLYDESEVYETTVKFFDVKFLNRQSHLTAICRQCWSQISNFSDFQQSVYEAQKKFLADDKKDIKTVVKTEPEVYAIQLSRATNAESINEEQEYISLPELELIDVHDDDEYASDYETPYMEFVVSEIDDPAEKKKQQPINTSNLLVERGANSFKCELCGECHTSQRELKTHMSCWHSETVKRQEEADAKHTCFECGKVSKSHVALTKHIWYHRTKRRFKCTVCDKMFLTASNLRDHSVIHMGKDIQVKRRYTCTICDKTLMGATDFREHIATHTGMNIYTCPHCPESFKYRSSMHAHRKKAHPKEFAVKRLNRMESQDVEID